jgi:hypothetical protein
VAPTAGQTRCAVLATFALLLMAAPAVGRGTARAGRIQQQVEAGALLPGQHLFMWILVSELDAGQEVSVRIEPSEPLHAVDPACAPDGAAYLCAVRAKSSSSTAQLQLEFVAGAPGRFTLTSRIVHSGVSDTDALDVLPVPEAGRTVAVVDEGSCTHGRPLSARIPGASAFTSACPGLTLAVGSRFKWSRYRGAEFYWTRRGRMHHAQLSGYKGATGVATVTQPGGRTPRLRLTKPARCRGFESIQAISRAPGELRIDGRLVRVTFKKGAVVVKEYCDRAEVIQVGGTVVIRDLVHGRTVRFSGNKYVVRR